MSRRQQIENRYAPTIIGGLSVMAGLASLLAWAGGTTAGAIVAGIAIGGGLLSWLSSMFESGMSDKPGKVAMVLGIIGMALTFSIGSAVQNERKSISESVAVNKAKGDPQEQPSPRELKGGLPNEVKIPEPTLEEIEAKETARRAAVRKDENEAAQKEKEESDARIKAIEVKRKEEAEKKLAADEKAASQLLTIAKQFHASKSYDISIPRLKDIAKKYPDTKAGKEAAELIEAHAKKK